MDGFDVGDFQFNHVYNVTDELGRYLIIAGYGEPAIAAADLTHDRPSKRRPRKRR